MTFSDDYYGVLVVSGIFLLIAFAVTKENAKYLLSGYNTMSDEARKRVDIVSYLAFFKRFHCFLAIMVVVLAFVLSFLLSTNEVLLISIGIFPIASYIYFLIAGAKYTKNPTKKERTYLYIGVAILVLLLSYMLYGFFQK